jgi:hypothetical protein
MKKDKYTEPLYDWMDFDEGTFDYNSIMLYPSTASAADSRCWTDPNRLDLCPLAAKMSGSRWTYGAAIAPSIGDVAFFKKYYRWIGGPAPVVSSSAAAGSSTPRAVSGGTVL